MDNIYRNFYRNVYLRSGGYIPSHPLGCAIFPGDFFQIRNGHIVILGNIFTIKLQNCATPKWARV